MSKKKDFIPSDEAELVDWLKNFALKLPAYLGTITTITAGDITQASADATFFEEAFAMQGQAKDLRKNLSKYKDDVTYGAIGAAPPTPSITINAPTPVATGIIARSRALANRIKADTACTESAKVDLRIVGEEHVVDVANSKPVLQFFKEPHGWRIEFNLLQFFDGVSIYKKLPSAAGFTLLAIDRHAPYIENSPVENGTQYYAFFLKGDVEVGLQSDIVTLQV